MTIAGDGIRAILFDADGVIQYPAPDLPMRIQEAFGIPAEQSVDFLRNIVSPAERRALTGKRDFFEELTEEFAHHGLTAPTPDSTRIFTLIERYTDVMELIRSLREGGISCFLATNQVRFRARHMSEVLGYQSLFDREFYSCHLGYAKPDPEYFRAILRSAALPAEAALFVDDREENVSAAKQAGMHAEIFDAKSCIHRRETLQALFACHGVAIT